MCGREKLPHPIALTRQWKGLMDWACVSALATLFFKALASGATSFPPTLCILESLPRTSSLWHLWWGGGVLCQFLVVATEPHIELEHR